MQIDATSRQITGQVNINVEELKSFLLPLPSMEIQEKIVKNIEMIKNEIKDLREKILYNKQFALNDFESEIFNETK
jgi:restriction endonuclease S subunit